MKPRRDPAAGSAARHPGSGPGVARGSVARVRSALAFAGMALSVACEPAGVPEREPPATPEEERGREILAAAIDRHGWRGFQEGTLEFTFRGDRFRVVHDGGLFLQERNRETEDGTVTDVMTNDGAFRWVDGAAYPLSALERRSLETGVNSVVYFAFLPYRLEDQAVRARHLGSSSLDGEPYQLVEVTFEEVGGGRDHEDRFLYWIHESERTLDYLAYHYHTDGGGTRFREAFNRRSVDGLVLQDYRNYAAGDHGGESADPTLAELERYGDLFEERGLRWVSDVVLEEVRIGPLPDPRPWDAVAAGSMPGGTAAPEGR